MKARHKYFLISLLVCLMCQAGAVADDVVQIGLIYYRLDDTDMTAEVMAAPFVYDKNGNIDKSGYYDEVEGDWNERNLDFYFYNDVVKYNGKEYKITKIGDKAFAYLVYHNYEYTKYLGEYISKEVPVEIKLPESLTCLGDSAFFHSTAIGSVTFPEKLSTFGKDIFIGCEMPCATINIPNIPAKLFHDCTINAVKIEDSVETIGIEAFANCNISALDISGDLKEIQEKAFYGINGLTKISVVCDIPPMTAENAFGPDSASPAFSAALNVPEKDYEYYSNTAPWCWFSEINVYGKGTLVDGIYYQLDSENGTAIVSAEDAYLAQTGKKVGHYTGTVCVPEKIRHNGIAYDVTEVGDWAFARCSDLESVILPNSIIRIGEYAFYYSKGKEGRYDRDPFSLSLPKSLEHIGKNAFDGARITELRIPPSMKQLSDYSLYGSRLNELILPDDMECIGAYAIAKCTHFNKIVLPKRLRQIKEKAFWGTGGDMWINCDTPPETSPDAFDGYRDDSGIWCGMIEGYTELYVFEKDKEYYQSSEPWCRFEIMACMDEKKENDYFNLDSRYEDNEILYYLNDFSYWASVTGGWDSVNNCQDSGYYHNDVFVPTRLITNSSPDDSYNACHYQVVAVEPEAFMDATSLTSVTLPDGLIWVGRKAFARSGVRHVDWPKSVAEVADSMFMGSELREIVLPEGVTTLKESAMAMCKSLASVTLPSTLTEVGPKTFVGSRIEEITILSEEVPETSPDAFGKDPDDRFWDIFEATLRVPQGCAWKYEQTEPWCNFRYIEEMEESSVETLVDNNDGLEVYTLDGRRVSAADFSGGSLPHGVYVVKSAGKVRKVLK